MNDLFSSDWLGWAAFGLAGVRAILVTSNLVGNAP
jgi:hypothetical protein